MNKKILKRLKKTLKNIDEEKEKFYTSEEVFESIRKHVEEEKHFPYNAIGYVRRLPFRLHQTWWYVRGLLWDRHNVVKIKTLPPTWIDADTKLLHSSFKIFCDVIEKEKILDNISFDYTDEIERVKKEDWGDGKNKEQEEFIKQLQEAHTIKQTEEKEIKDLYDWWKVRRPKREEDLDNNFNYDNEDNSYQEDTDMLIRLMKIRKCLWT